MRICHAIAYAHAEGVIHRDLKPSNVMIGPYGEVTILDWGLAKLLADDRVSFEFVQQTPAFRCLPECDFESMAGTVIGTLSYSAPEQARGELALVDQRADIFALGSILAEILTGKPPFHGRNAKAAYELAIRGDVSRIVDLLDGCAGPRPIVGLAKKCLSPNRADRPNRVEELIEEVTGYLESGQRRAERELVRFFDLTLDLFCIANFQGHFTRVNENLLRCLGYTRDELLSRPFLDYVHPEDRVETLAELQKLSQGDPTLRFRNRYRHADGHYKCLEWNSRSVPEEAAIYAVAREVPATPIRLEPTGVN